MPITAINMAQPFNINTDADYMLQDEIAHVKERHKKYIYLKVAELICIMIAIVLFTMSFDISDDKIIIRDLLISGFFGGLLVYPLFIILLPLNIDKSTTNALLLLNAICSLVLFVTGFIIFSSWYDMQGMLLSDEFSFDTDVSKIRSRTTYKFLTTLCILLDGILYLGEAFLQLLEILQFN